MSTRVDIDPGACGKGTSIEVSRTGEDHCSVQLRSACPIIRRAAASLSELRPSEEESWETSRVHRVLREQGVHTACPVPTGLLKAIEVASRAKSPQDVHIRFSHG